MSNLVVLGFETQHGAKEMTQRVKNMQREQILRLDDAAEVVRDQDGKVRITQSQSLVGAGAFGGAFWGMLIGLLFFMPWLGMALGAVTGALGAKFADIGIDDNFIKQVSSTIHPGSSALFLMVQDSTPDKVLDELSGVQGVTVIKTSLSKEAEEKLREAFATPTREEALKKAG